MSKTEHNGYQDRRLNIVEKHIETLNHNSTVMQQDIAVIKETLKNNDKTLREQNRVQWLILGTILALALGIILGV